MNSRIKEVRTAFGKSQTDFAKALSISRSAICKIESGENTPSEQTIKLICREFNINEEWLTDGIGEMKKTTDRKLSGYLSEIATGNDEFIQNLIEVYMELDQTSKEALKEIAKKMAEKQKKSGG